MDRRRFLAALAALGCIGGPRAQTAQRPRFSVNPFALGVASGYPHAGGATLWTRLIDLAQPGGLDAKAIRVGWEVAEDDRFGRITARGAALAEPNLGHSVHVDVRGLKPQRWYRYRFLAGGAESRAGRFRTAPAAHEAPYSVNFAVASCQQYEQGFYAAYRHVVRDQPDLVVFLGDYIYETSWGRVHVRKHGAPEAYSLADYRARHALYKSDPDLQAAHAACAWLLTWDDHEVDNDYANDRPEDGLAAELFLARRAAAYQAYYENMPLPAHMKPRGTALLLHTVVPWGRLARFYLLDDRQYRSHPASCPRPGRASASEAGPCEGLLDPARSMLGAEQERWLGTALSANSAAWNLVGQQTLIAPFSARRDGSGAVWPDGWDGYPAARQRLMHQLGSVANPVTFGGDMHSFHVADLRGDLQDYASPVVASEFVTTSITSQPRSQSTLDALARANPHVKLAEGRYRGYTRVVVDSQRLVADLRALRSVADAGADCFTLSSYVVENGRPGPQRT